MIVHTTEERDSSLCYVSQVSLRKSKSWAWPFGEYNSPCPIALIDSSLNMQITGLIV